MFAILVHLKSPSFPWKPHFRRKSCGGSGLKLSDRRTAFSRSRFLNYSTPPNENDLLFTIIRTSGKRCKLKGEVSLPPPPSCDVTHQTVPALITLFQLAPNVCECVGMNLKSFCMHERRSQMKLPTTRRNGSRGERALRPWPPQPVKHFWWPMSSERELRRRRRRRRVDRQGLVENRLCSENGDEQWDISGQCKKFRIYISSLTLIINNTQYWFSKHVHKFLQYREMKSLN